MPTSRGGICSSSRSSSSASSGWARRARSCVWWRAPARAAMLHGSRARRGCGCSGAGWKRASGRRPATRRPRGGPRIQRSPRRPTSDASHSGTDPGRRDLALRIYDTLTREKREFVPVRPGHVGMYVCGMTVQNKPHVGHIRASLSAEVMRRWFEHLGQTVTYVYNFTDVDDKIIERAATEGIGYESVSERNIDAYLKFADLHN